MEFCWSVPQAADTNSHTFSHNNHTAGHGNQKYIDCAIMRSSLNYYYSPMTDVYEYFGHSIGLWLPICILRLFNASPSTCRTRNTVVTVHCTGPIDCDSPVHPLAYYLPVWFFVNEPVTIDNTKRNLRKGRQKTDFHGFLLFSVSLLFRMLHRLSHCLLFFYTPRREPINMYDAPCLECEKIQLYAKDYWGILYYGLRLAQMVRVLSACDRKNTLCEVCRYIIIANWLTCLILFLNIFFVRATTRLWWYTLLCAVNASRFANDK